MSNTVTGEMADTLDYWTLVRKFSTTPVLNESFIQCVPDPRIFADTEGDHILAFIRNRVTVRRKLPVFGNPHL